MRNPVFRVRQLPGGKWSPEVSYDGAVSWKSYAWKAYARRGDAVRVVNMERVARGDGAWYVEGMFDVSLDEQVALTAWKESHAQAFAEDTAPQEDEAAVRRAEFALWLRKHGRLHDELTPRDFGLAQPALLEVGECS
jgi:hypothetical protein